MYIEKARFHCAGTNDDEDVDVPAAFVRNLAARDFPLQDVRHLPRNSQGRRYIKYILMYSSDIHPQVSVIFRSTRWIQLQPDSAARLHACAYIYIE
jgi:hypothetical protein